MLERKYWMNLTYLLLGFMICFTIFEISLGPTVFPAQIQRYSVYTVYTNASGVYSTPIDLLPSNDYTQLIDLDFSFKILNLVCNDSSPLLLILVHSAPDNFAKRKTIRETWGEKSKSVKIAFMTGAVKCPSLQRKLDLESSKHEDIVQGSFRDTYRNLTYKHVMVLKYAVYHCPQAKYILKTDDDIFVNMPLMINFLRFDLSPYGASNLLMCVVVEHARVLRSYRSKWRASFSEYKGRYYPQYCFGWAVLYSPDVVFSLYKESQKTDYFWIDDIHITGTLVKKVHISHTNMLPLVISHDDYDSILRNFGTPKTPVNNSLVNVSSPFLFGYADLQEYQIRSLWNFVQVQTTPKSILKYIE